jgi:hypothetical protein
MAYGTIKIDTITFTDGGIDKSVSISGLVQNPTFTGNITVTGTVSGNTVRGQTISGVTITGTTAQFTSGTFVSLTGTTLQGTTATYTTGSFTSLTGTTTSGTTANFVSGVFSTQISGATVTGTTANFTSGNFTSISGGTHTITSGVFAAGTAANPSISFTSDPNTGIYSPGADQVAISTNGTGRLFVDASGRVGIGSAPGALLDLAASNDGATGTTANNTLRFTDTDANTAADQPIGKIEWYSADTSSPGARAVSYIMSSAAGANSGGDIRFGISANAGTATEAARIDSSGRLLVGTSSSFDLNAVVQSVGTGAYRFEGFRFGSDNGILALGSALGTQASPSVNTAPNLGLGIIQFRSYDGAAYRDGAWISATAESQWASGDCPTRLVFSTTADGASSPTERVRIASNGITYIGNTTITTSSQQTTAPHAIIYSNGSSNLLAAGGLECNTTSTSARHHISFTNPNGVVGSISTSASATAYNTSSDYRLKENVVPLTGAADRLNQLQVHRFNFIADPDTTVDGFIAHEAQEVVPECVTGTKDEVDADGNPVYQGIDQSKLVPLLTAALQEALAEIESLKARLTAAGI